jgi:lipid-binding SYLF domain-containing protein
MRIIPLGEIVFNQLIHGGTYKLALVLRGSFQDLTPTMHKHHLHQEIDMKQILVFTLSVFLMAVPLSSHALFGKEDPAKERKQLQESRTTALEKLYKEKPAAREEIKSAVGYAVFSSIGINVFLVSTEKGGGILRDHRSDKDTYMKMFSAGGGVGMGVKDFSVVFIFHTVTAMEKFQTAGWDFSGKADASAESDNKGMGIEAVVTAVPGTTIYQLTDAGLALQATLQGTKFWADENLN